MRSDDLFLETVLLENGLVVVRLVHAEVVQKLAALCNLAKQSAACGVILLVFLKVASEETDFLGEDRDLHLGGAGVFFVNLAVGNQFLLGFALDGHDEWGGDNKNKESTEPRGATITQYVKALPEARIGGNCTKTAKIGKGKWDCFRMKSVLTFTYSTATY